MSQCSGCGGPITTGEEVVGEYGENWYDVEAFCSDECKEIYEEAEEVQDRDE